MTEPLDRLLRDAAGATPDPAASRHAVRAGLAPELARRRRGEKRAQVRRTLVVAAGLLIVLCGQLGSEDFVTVSATRLHNGKPWQVYKQGLGGEEMWLRPPGTPGGVDEKFASEWLIQKAAHEGVMVGVTGYTLGGKRWFKVLLDYEINGVLSMSDAAPDGWPEDPPPEIRAYGRANFMKVMAISHSRKPDFSVPMTFSGLEWDMNAWRVQLPGQPEVIYYTGLRKDGVRSKGEDPF